MKGKKKAVSISADPDGWAGANSGRAKDLARLTGLSGYFFFPFCLLSLRLVKIKDGRKIKALINQRKKFFPVLPAQ